MEVVCQNEPIYRFAEGEEEHILVTELPLSLFIVETKPLHVIITQGGASGTAMATCGSSPLVVIRVDLNSFPPGDPRGVAEG